MTESLEADVAIAGAGLAGLVAARRLAAAGAEPLVVEARERVGGRLLNEEIGDGKVVEVGGQWIGPTQERLAATGAADGRAAGGGAAAPRRPGAADRARRGRGADPRGALLSLRR